MAKSSNNTHQDPLQHKADLINSTPPVRNGRHSLLRRVMIWMALIAGVMLIGAAMIYFWLYQPAVRELSTLQNDLEGMNRELASVQSELQAARSDLDIANDTTASLEAQILEKDQLLSRKTQNELVLKALAEANIAQNAFAAQDLTTIRIALANIQEYLSQIDGSALDPVLVSGILDRTIQAQSSIENQSESLGAELDSLVLNLNQLLNLISSKP